MKKFCFKSNEHYFWKEARNYKCNTIREINWFDKRHEELIKHSLNGFNEGELEIEIIQENAENYAFRRIITDISLFKNFIIISWKPQDSVSEGKK